MENISYDDTDQLTTVNRENTYDVTVTLTSDGMRIIPMTPKRSAYGNLLKETGNVENPYRYAGYRYDKETGLYYLQSRYYNPETGRFFTRDKLEGDNKSPITFNKYTYSNNSPIIMVDSDGYRPLKPFEKRSLNQLRVFFGYLGFV